LQDIPEAHKECIDRGLGFVLLGAARRQEQRLANGVLQRVVGRVFQGLGPANHSQRWRHGHDGIADQREAWKHEQRPPHANEVENTRDRERLQQQTQQVHPGEIASVKAADKRSHRGLVSGMQLAGLLLHDTAQQELPGCIDHVQQHNEYGDEAQIAAREHEFEAVRTVELLVGMLVHHLVRPAGFHPVGRPYESGTNQQNSSCGGHERKRCPLQCFEQPGGCLRAGERSNGSADPNHRKQPFSLGFRVEVVRERPKLRDHKDVENADPDVECHANADAAQAESLKNQKVGCEEERQPDDQFQPVHSIPKESVERNQDH